jgi:phage host-nuclease inhibitor protein Gam
VRRSKRWVQKAIKHVGALKKWLKKEHPELLKENGEIAFTKLREWYEKHKDELTEHRKRQINLAFTLHKMAMRRRKRKK